MSADQSRRAAVPIRNSVFNPVSPSFRRPSLTFTKSQTSSPSTDDNNNVHNNVQPAFNTLHRQKSLIRPDRERINSNHPYYHYYAHASELAEDRIADSQTGNTPRRANTTRKANTTRRGKSASEKERPKSVKRKKQDFAVPQKKKRQSLPSCWIIYCYIVTFYAPSFLLSTCGKCVSCE